MLELVEGQAEKFGEERERSQIESASLRSEGTGKGELIQKKVSEVENILGLDEIVRKLEASRTGTRLPDEATERTITAGK